MPQTDGIVDIRSAATIDVEKSFSHQQSVAAFSASNPEIPHIAA
jgi:hypothetical protein